MNDTEKQKIREALAEIEHQQWEDWSRNLVTTEKLSPERVMRWNKLWRPYNTLTEEEKDQDRKYADKVLSTLDKTIKSKLEAVEGEIELKRRKHYNEQQPFLKHRNDYNDAYNKIIIDVLEIINKHK